jgi:hypothetical protein
MQHILMCTMVSKVMKRRLPEASVRAVTFSALLLAALPGAAAAQLTPAERAALDDLAPTYAQRFELRRGWYRGRAIRYFDIGPVDVSVAPVFYFVRGFDAAGRPVFVDGQQPVFSSLPGLPGYSGIWQVHFVVVPAGYRANAVTEGRVAVGMGLRGEARLVIPGSYVNLPIVPGGSTLDGDPARRPLAGGWFKGRAVSYFDFGRSPLAPAPIYAFILGLDGDAPRFLREQANVVDVAPDSVGDYMDMWDVHFVTVPAGYAPDTIRDLATLLAEERAGRVAIRRIGSVRNCPVVIVEERTAPRRPL